MDPSASTPSGTWPVELARAKGFELVNTGYLSRPTLGMDGDRDGPLQPAVGCYLSGFNHFYNQASSGRTPAVCEAETLAYLDRFFLHAPSARLFYISPIFSLVGQPRPTFGLQDYRDAIRRACEQFRVSRPGLRLQHVDGLSLMRNEPDRLAVDGIHPSDLGHRELAAALAALI